MTKIRRKVAVDSVAVAVLLSDSKTNCFKKNRHKNIKLASNYVFPRKKIQKTIFEGDELLLLPKNVLKIPRKISSKTLLHKQQQQCRCPNFN